MTPREAYAEDVRRRPTYDGGAPRPAWDDLCDVARESWRRNPTPRNWNPTPQRKET